MARLPKRLPVYEIGTTGVPDVGHFEDNEYFHYGTGKDISVSFDATNMVWKDSSGNVIQKLTTGGKFHPKQFTNVKVASEYATSGSGTAADPWVDGIQNAIAAFTDAELPETGIGGIIFLPAGTFYEYKNAKSTCIQMDGDAASPICSIIGSGAHASKIYCPDSQNCNVILGYSGASIAALTIFADFELDCNKAGNGTGGIGIRVHSTWGDCKIYRIYLHNAKGNGIQSAGWNADIVDCAIENGDGDGIYIEDGASAQIRGCYIIDNDNGVRIDGRRHHVVDNIIDKCAYHGVHLDQATECIIANNKIEDFDDDDATTYHGIFVEGDGAACAKNIISGNVIMSAKGKYGIQVGKDNTDTDVNDNLICNNIIQNPNSGHMHVFPAVEQNNRISGNLLI